MSMHKEALPLKKASLSKLRTLPESCQVVEMLPTTLDGMNGSDVVPSETEKILSSAVLNCPSKLRDHIFES